MLLEKGYAKKLDEGRRWSAHCANIGSDTTFPAKATRFSRVSERFKIHDFRISRFKITAASLGELKPEARPVTRWTLTRDLCWKWLH